MENCLYCKNKEKRDNLMIYIADLGVSKLYLFREQTYYGRCIVAYNEHNVELVALDSKTSGLFMDDIKRVGLSIQKTVNPSKVNYGMYSDSLPHLHVHVVPKQVGGYTFGSTFDMNVEPPHYLTDEDYVTLIQKIKDNL